MRSDGVRIVQTGPLRAHFPCCCTMSEGRRVSMSEGPHFKPLQHDAMLLKILTLELVHTGCVCHGVPTGDETRGTGACTHRTLVELVYTVTLNGGCTQVELVYTVTLQSLYTRDSGARILYSLSTSESGAPIAVGKLRGEDYNFEFHGKVKDGKMHFRLVMTEAAAVSGAAGCAYTLNCSVCIVFTINLFSEAAATEPNGEHNPQAHHQLCYCSSL
eukprot:scaffold24566_cov21-Tisochrysis_lutea.AAC.2